MINVTIEQILKCMQELNWYWATTNNKVPNKKQFLAELSRLIKDLKGSEEISSGGVTITKVSLKKHKAIFDNILVFNIPKECFDTNPKTGIPYSIICNVANKYYKKTSNVVAFIKGIKWCLGYIDNLK